MAEEVLLMSFADRQEAEIARGLLSANGIESTVESDACGQEYPNLEYVSGVQLMVSDEDLDEARRILEKAGGVPEADLEQAAMTGSGSPESGGGEEEQG